ncbi:MAG: muramidase, partial [Sphingomonas sp.]
MLPVGLTAKAIQLCAAGLGGGVTPLPAPYAISVHAGAALSPEPVTEADAEATVRDLITLGADFVAGP